MNTTAWLIIVIVLAVVFDIWLIRWWRTRRSSARAAAQSDTLSATASTPEVAAASANPSDTVSSSSGQLLSEEAPHAASAMELGMPTTAVTEAAPRRRFISVLQQHAALSATVALVIAFVAQTTLTANQPALASTGYLAAALIFVFALSPFVPENFTSEALPEEPLVPAQRQPQIKTPARPTTPTPSFVRYWRYYTVANLLTGTQPDIPAESAAPESVATASVPSPIDVTGGPVFLPTATESTVRPAQVSVWISGANTFIEPQAVVVTPQGHVLVIDTGQRMVYRFTPNGELLGQWTVPELPPLHLHSLAASPDGSRLYIADTANRRVQVITLT